MTANHRDREVRREDLRVDETGHALCRVSINHLVAKW
jgi:hypothetical protein